MMPLPLFRSNIEHLLPYFRMQMKYIQDKYSKNHVLAELRIREICVVNEVPQNKACKDFIREELDK